MPARRWILTTCLLLYAAAQALFLFRIEAATKLAGDERHYVPAARQWLAMQDPGNAEHPPLGKQLIAIGMALCGDRPLGWRVMSTVFGSLTLVGMYLWGLALFRDQRAALLTALISLANQLLYVQSRIGMLDVFMFGFAVFGLAAVCRAWDPTLPRRPARLLLLLAGVAFGLATACKWTGAMAWGLSAGAVVGARLTARSGLFKNLTTDDLVSAFVVFPIAAYLVTFFPYLFVAHQPRYNLLDLLAMQKQIWELQQRVVTPMRYHSAWPSWPFMLRPFWYYFEWEPDHANIRGIVLLGNPLVLWGGLIALAACAWAWWRRRSREPFWILLAWGGLYLGHAVLRRKVGYFFYYFPAAMTLSLAWAFVLREIERRPRLRATRVPWPSLVFLAATFGFCIYFFDLLSAAPEYSEAFRSRMWLRSWY
jgi:dolichyl-phosphate-mannose--protein O-mannosyl transferase